MKFSAVSAAALIAGASAQANNGTVVVTATTDVVVPTTIIETITHCTGSDVVSCHYVTSTAVAAVSTAPAVPQVSGNGTAPVPTAPEQIGSNSGSVLSGSIIGAVAIAGAALLL